jgi:hypothetical protein
VCFISMNKPTQHVLITNNSAAAPFCGSGNKEHLISAALPKCGDIPKVAKVRPCRHACSCFPPFELSLLLRCCHAHAWPLAFPLLLTPLHHVQSKVPITLRLKANKGKCEDLTAVMSSFMKSTLGFAFDTTDVTCKAAAAPPPSRRLFSFPSRALLQAGNTVSLVADVAGPGAGGVIKEALKLDSPVFGDFNSMFDNQIASADAIDTSPPPPPPVDVTTSASHTCPCVPW